MQSAQAAAGFVGAGKRMQPGDVVAAAARLGCSPAVIAAVLEVESSGSGFDAAGRPKILFEPHVFYRELAGSETQLAAALKGGLAYPHQGMQPYPPTSEANYCRLKRACLLAPDAALRSASWGIAQVMGFNFAIAYASVGDMVQACMDSEAAQFGLLLAYAERNGLVAALRSENFAAFARGYNGPGAVAQYAGRLAAACQRHKGSVPLQPRPVPAQPLPVPAQPHPAVPAPQPTADSLMDAEWLQIRGGSAA